MTYRELIAAIRKPGPVILTTMGNNSILSVEVVKADLVRTLEANAQGDLDADSEWNLETIHGRKYLEPV